METKNKKVEFISGGFVYGSFWGGGEGAYDARKIHADSKEELIKKATELLENGGLDSGMGFMKLLGALLDIEEHTSMEIDGKTFTNTEYHSEFIGDLSEEQQDFLIGIPSRY
jgi:hypothetical protein